jgi:hypothetical protein
MPAPIWTWSNAGRRGASAGCRLSRSLGHSKESPAGPAAAGPLGPVRPGREHLRLAHVAQRFLSLALSVSSSGGFSSLALAVSSTIEGASLTVAM